MSSSTARATLGFSILSFVASATTLGIIFFGAQRMQTEINDLKGKTNRTIKTVRAAFEALED